MKKTVRFLSLALAALLALSLTGCGGPASDPIDAKAALEKNDYKAVKLDADGGILESGIIGLLKLAGVDNITSVVTGEKDGEKVTIVYFDSSDAAKVELEDVQKYADGQECTRSGSMIWFGTEAAVKAAK